MQLLAIYFEEQPSANCKISLLLIWDKQVLKQTILCYISSQLEFIYIFLVPLAFKSIAFFLIKKR